MIYGQREKRQMLLEYCQGYTSALQWKKVKSANVDMMTQPH
jgi:hypothetical protein